VSASRTSRRGFRAAVILTAVVTCGAGLIAAPAANAAPKVTSDASTTAASGPDPSRARVAPTSVDRLGFWTDEKVKRAIAAPLEVLATPAEASAQRSAEAAQPKLPKPVNVSDPVAATAPEGGVSTRAGAVTPRTVGKLLFSEANGDLRSCTGAVINSAAKNLVHTAGHCVYEIGHGFHQNMVFIPGYYNGSSSDFAWNWKLARTFNSYMNSADPTHDQAFVSFYPQVGQELANRVGANGLTIGLGQRVNNIRIWGYPADPPYTGNIAYYCSGNTYINPYDSIASDGALPCDMTGGASGGPWYNVLPKPDTGYVYAVTSRRLTYGGNALLATPDGPDVQSMYNQMG
jgi:V8-like Glu-specific endopeptidase